MRELIQQVMERVAAHYGKSWQKIQYCDMTVFILSQFMPAFEVGEMIGLPHARVISLVGLWKETTKLAAQDRKRGLDYMEALRIIEVVKQQIYI